MQLFCYDNTRPKPSTSEGISFIPPPSKDGDVSDSGETNPSEGVCVEFTSLRCVASGRNDTARNLAYHVQEPDPWEGVMNKLKERKRKKEIWWEKGRQKS